MTRQAEALVIGGQRVAAGARATIDLPVADLYTHAPLTLPVQVVNGRHAGPRLFVCAAIHGDELNGVEIIRRLLKLPELERLRGTLIAVPIVNVFGFVQLTRYLPDRRDLNRSFPGSERGSVAARLAHLFANEVVARADCGIDIHTGALHRSNLPHLRANLDDAATLELARAFSVPVLINANIRDGSLREYTAQRGIPMLVYEGGEALRFDELAIRAGLRGVRRVMRALGMLRPRRGRAPAIEPVIARSTSWVRAPSSGIVRAPVELGRRVRQDQPLATVSDPFGAAEVELLAPFSGIVIGRSNLPLVHEGDALFHLASFERTRAVVESLAEFQESVGSPGDEPTA